MNQNRYVKVRNVTPSSRLLYFFLIRRDEKLSGKVISSVSNNEKLAPSTVEFEDEESYVLGYN